MYSGHWPFLSSFRHSLHRIQTAYTTLHMLCSMTKIFIVCQKGIKKFQMLCVGFKAVEIITHCYVVPCWLTNNSFNHIELCSNLVLVGVCNIQCGLLLQRTSFKISFVCASNAMDQMLCCCIAVSQYFFMICRCQPSANAFGMRRITHHH